MSNRGYNPFRPGDSVRCVDDCDCEFALKHGDIHTITAVGKGINSDLVSIDKSAPGWYHWRFELVEASKPEVVDNKKPLKLEYENIVMVFDVSIPNSRKFIDAVLNAIYSTKEENVS